MSDPPKKTCEACRGALERLISRTSFHLKGGGWYKDLYSSPKAGTDSSTAEGGAEGASDAASGDNAKGEGAAGSKEPGGKESGGTGGKESGGTGKESGGTGKE